MAPKKDIGLVGLTAIAFSSMVGGGIFNIAQNMASTAGLEAVVLAWIITGCGMIFLVLTFKILSDKFSYINRGIYEYAKEGFGNYIGFNIAWGYWLCVALGNVAFTVMLNDALGAFFPIFLEHSWPSIIFCVALVWLFFAVVCGGEVTASVINSVMTILKFCAIVIIIALLIFYFRTEQLFSNLNPEISGSIIKPLGSFKSQVMGTMLITMFCFVGVEGAVMLSSHARNSKDVGRASVIGFYTAIIIYALISILCYGVRDRIELAQMHDPSIAYVLRSISGNWAYYFVIFTVILSILSGFLAWTLLCAQTPYGAAQVKIFPSYFLKLNRNQVPINGLLVSTIFMSLFIALVCTAPDVYLAALNLTTIMVLPTYGFAGAFLLKTSLINSKLSQSISPENRCKYFIIGLLCTLYCIWCIIAGGSKLFMASSILYLFGFFFYYKAYKENKGSYQKQEKMLTKTDYYVLAVMIIAATISVILIADGNLNLSEG